jgi:hypothetical protein
MVWSFIRVAIFTTAFLFGLFFSGSSDGAAGGKIDSIRSVREPIETRCVDPNFTLVRADGQRPILPLVTGM